MLDPTTYQWFVVRMKKADYAPGAMTEALRRCINRADAHYDRISATVDAERVAPDEVALVIQIVEGHARPDTPGTCFFSRTGG